jgi:hypothetical protein
MPLAELDCVLQYVAAPGWRTPVAARFSYRSSDPYGVHVTFHTEQDPVSWVFARELLSEGTVRPSGIGDVRLWPGGGEQADLLFLEVFSPYGQALFTVPLDVVTPWLARTYHLVPAGFEGASLDLDGELSKLLGEVA